MQLAERWLLAPLRHHTLFSLSALNEELAERREVLNERAFQKLDGTRRTRFAELDQPALRPLPPTPYEFAEWRVAKVNIDYHISVEKHLYSVPYTLVRAEVDVRLTAAMVEILHQGKRVAVHPRAARSGGASTDPTHRPKSHQAHLEWTPSRLVRWGESVGPATGHVIKTMLDRYPHRSKAIAPAWASCRWPGATVLSGSKPRASARGPRGR